MQIVEEHKFEPKRILGEGWQAGCTCGWRGGIVKDTRLSARRIWRKFHAEKIGGQP